MKLYRATYGIRIKKRDVLTGKLDIRIIDKEEGLLSADNRSDGEFMAANEADRKGKQLISIQLDQ